MINVVDGGTIASSGVVGRLSFEHVVCGQQVCSGPSISLESLGELRLNPSAIASNLVLEPELIMRELKSCGGGGLLCDVTTVDEGRDVDGLARIAQKNGMSIAYGASVTSSTSNAKTAESSLRRELEVGQRRAAFITLRLPVEDAVLEGASRASEKTGALVVVTLPAAATIDDFFDDATRLVERLGCFVLVDGFGRPIERTTTPDFDTDDKERLRALFDEGEDDSHLLVSVGVRYKTHLKSFGGFGYDYAARLLAGSDKKKSHLLLNQTVLSVLAFYRPPKKNKVPVATLQCSLCAQFFEVRVGYHYAKFDFVYCSRSCLDRHEQDLFSPHLVEGPTATEQSL